MAALGDSQDLSLYVAWLSYVGGYTQAQIATRLSLSRAKVHRLIGEAHKAGRIHVFIDGSPGDLVGQEDRIAQRFGLTQCQVVPDVEEAGQRGGNVLALGAAAARYLHGRLASGQVKSLGVSWGRSLAEMARHLPREQYRDLSIVSLIGSLTQQAAINPFDVVYRLAETTGGQGFFLPVPFIADTVANREVLTSQHIVAEALDRARAVDLCVIGIAAMRAEQPIFQFERGLLRSDVLNRLKDSGVVAETVGHFLEADGRLADIDINQRTIGLSLAELAGREVVAVAGGADKAQAISAVLRSGIVDRLIIDAPAADALDRIADADKSCRSPGGTTDSKCWPQSLVGVRSR